MEFILGIHKKQGNFFHQGKEIYRKPTGYILNGERLNVLPPA